MQTKVLLFTIALAFPRPLSLLFHLVTRILGLNFYVSLAELLREVIVVGNPRRVLLMTKLWTDVI